MTSTSDSERVWLVVSAAALGVPTVIAAFRQPMFVAVVLANATYASVGYHWASEDQYEWGFQDMFWANFLVMLLSVHMSLAWSMCVATGKTFGKPRTVCGVKWGIPKSPELTLAVLFGVAALFAYLYRGRLVCNPDTDTSCRPSQYNDYHIAWHFLSAAATACLMWMPTGPYLASVFHHTWVDLVARSRLPPPPPGVRGRGSTDDNASGAMRRFDRYAPVNMTSDDL